MRLARCKDQLAIRGLRVVRQLDESTWRRFVDEHPLGNVFHTPEMFEVFRRAKGHLPTLWAALDPSGEVLALFSPVNLSPFAGPLRLLTTRAVAYGSVLCAPGARGLDALAELLKSYRQDLQGWPLFTELRNLADTREIRPTLFESGFAHEEHLNYLIDLNRPPEAILQAISPRTRQYIRHGLRQRRVRIGEITDREELPALYGVLRRTYERARMPLADCSLFSAAFDVLQSRGMARFSIARVDGAPAAVSIELLHKGTAYGWYGGTNREYGAYMPNELLTWGVLEWCAESGYRVYDFGGAGRPGERYGVRDFKSKFGGDLVSFGREICVHADSRLRLSRTAFDLYRRLRLPPSQGTPLRRQLT